MPMFGKASTERLNQAHPDLRRLFSEVIKHFDCTIVCSYRNQEDQDRAVKEGNSTKPWPKSKHNSFPSLAVDAVPYYPGGIRWSDKEGMCLFAGFVKGIALQLGIKIRWGGDWDGDNDRKDQTGLDDLPHFELVN